MLGLLHAAAVLFATELCVTLVDKDATSSEYQRVVEQFRLFCFWEGGRFTHVVVYSRHRVTHTQGRGSRRMCSRPHEVRLCLFLGTPSHRWYKPFSQTGHRCRTRKVSLSLTHTHTDTHDTRICTAHSSYTILYISVISIRARKESLLAGITEYNGNNLEKARKFFKQAVGVDDVILRTFTERATGRGFHVTQAREEADHQIAFMAEKQIFPQLTDEELRTLQAIQAIRKLNVSVLSEDADFLQYFGLTKVLTSPVSVSLSLCLSISICAF